MSAIDQANQKAVEKMMAVRPLLVDVARAKDVLPGMKDNVFLHAGPPVSWEHMSGPLKGAMIGGAIYEGKAKNEEEAIELLKSGEIEFAPCHHYNAVGPMAGVTTPSQQVYVVEDKESGHRAFSNMNEGFGKVLRYGAYDDEVLNRLRWLDEVFAPTIKEALELMGGLDVKTMISQALHMGDDAHNRNRATTSLMIRMLAPYIAEAEFGKRKDYDAPRIDLSKISSYFKGQDESIASEVLAFMGGNDLAALNPIMAGSKAMADAARNIENSTMVVAMARNGTEYGIQVSGTGDKWFTGPANVPDGLFFSGFSGDDANRDIGDSVITETIGVGGFAMAAAPAIVNFIGGKPADAYEATNEMYEITLTENKDFNIPALDFKGTPTGIDVRKVIEKDIVPRINTGIAHKDAGIGQVGAGIVSPPKEAFVKALKEMAK